MATYNNFEALMKSIKKPIPDIQKKEVFEKVKSIEQEHIQIDVYDVYSPNDYNRRMSLLDDENIVGEVVGDTLEVKNIATPNESISQPQTQYNPSDHTQFAKWIILCLGLKI